ncbi:hypothetical protein HBA55_29670 [Pseudomaricurvus alkylphenolicus]|uniref:hypothetical protein n=1 Tax=Pseudomaricurvus alkylphenolicus TaxID=1306991 RepID=UPI0014221B78|nr:hypothetical protein [Pseudomaricurvus alkylphenolicus]NIB43808.1 hypothetical protein [Pseudomaricurvus alkylphenolicus]
MKLVDTSGTPLVQKKAAKAVFFVSGDGEHWELLKPADVPDGLKDHDVMGYLMAGEIIEIEGTSTFYRVEQIH